MYNNNTNVKLLLPFTFGLRVTITVCFIYLKNDRYRVHPLLNPREVIIIITCWLKIKAERGRAIYDRVTKSRSYVFLNRKRPRDDDDDDDE